MSVCQKRNVCQGEWNNKQRIWRMVQSWKDAIYPVIQATEQLMRQFKPRGTEDDGAEHTSK
jgi:hypothetical protein